MLREIFAALIILGFVMVVAQGEAIRPETDVINKTVDGEYYCLFGPGSFNFPDGQFPNAVAYKGGSAFLGSMAKNTTG